MAARHMRNGGMSRKDH